MIEIKISEKTFNVLKERMKDHNTMIDKLEEKFKKYNEKYNTFDQVIEDLIFIADQEGL